MKRDAFSLLEVMIATAVLAASAMVLSSLIGLGSKFGNRAEERTIALAQAESLMDEFVAQLGSGGQEGSGGNRLNEITGELPGPPARAYRISASPFTIGSANGAQISSLQGQNQSGSNQRGLLRVTVEVFESAGMDVGSEAKSLIELSRLVRQPQVVSASNGMLPEGASPDAMPLDAAQSIAPSTQGGFP